MNNKIRTKDVAKIFGVTEETIRHSICIKGHYNGVKPTKAAHSRFLYWDEAEVMSSIGAVGQPSTKQAESRVAEKRKNIASTESMSIRDQFALAAMQGLMANPEWWNHIGGTDSKKAAKVAYIHADAMLYARLRKSAGDD